MQTMKKVVVAHPMQQHSYYTATALQQAGMLEAYITTVYYNPKRWLYRFLGKVLPKYPRESYFLTSKLPVYMLTSAEHAEQVLEEQLSRLNTNYLDFYLLHALNRHTFDERVVGFDLMSLCEKWKREGKVRHIGFSFHDDNETFERILRYYPWDVCQIQYNYMDEHSQAGRKGLNHAYAKGIPVVIMEPLRGGRLVNQLPEKARLFDSYVCECCGESTGANWIRLAGGKKLCLDCYETYDRFNV